MTWFSPTEESRLNATADLLNKKLSSAASTAGFTFADPTSGFVGHAVCDDTEWINGLSNPVSESYHPNRPGHSSGYAPVVGSHFSGSQVVLSTMTAQERVESTTRLQTQQRAYAAKDRTIRPKEFKAPDLDSPEIRKAAARAGVDLSSRASIDAADKRYAAMQASGR